MHALLVEKDLDYARTISVVLEDRGWLLFCAQEFQQVQERLQEGLDLALVDLATDQETGFSICSLLRGQADIPLVLLADRSLEDRALEGLEEQADYYLLKPFSPRQLTAAVKSVLRRRAVQQSQRFHEEAEVDGITFSLLRHELRVDGRKVALSGREFDLLNVLLVNRGQLLTRTELATRAWGYDYEGADREVDVYITRIRHKIEPDPKVPRLILTERGVGYRFKK
ncbi:MAG: response regulator transcription factor [Chloroflexi bacterium]|nr:response regulator transcription factor [Chloroflexota bacterium]